jgi:hypothetical protein
MRTKDVNKINVVQATTIKIQLLFFFGLGSPSEVVFLLFLFKNDKDSLSTTTVLAFLFSFIVLGPKTKGKNERILFIWSQKDVILKRRGTPNPTAKRLPQVQLATNPLKKFWQGFPCNLEVRKEGTAKGILFPKKRRKQTAKTKSFKNKRSTQE